jgi:hypothetical protein
MAGRKANWMWTIFVAMLFGLNAYFLFQWAKSSDWIYSPASSESPAPADRFATDDGKFKIRIAHLILIHVS